MHKIRRKRIINTVLFIIGLAVTAVFILPIVWQYLGAFKPTRDVIAFPKSYRGLSLMDGSPSAAEPEVLRELGIRFVEESESDAGHRK